MQSFEVWAVVSFNGRTFDHPFNITLLPDESLNKDTFYKYAHIRQGWKVESITLVDMIGADGKYQEQPTFEI
jgi:uncharacterized protein YprB with RNaseH-like and TPR domain